MQNKFSFWVLKVVLQKLFKQGKQQQNLILVHKAIQKALESEFTDEHFYTMFEFNNKCVNKAWRPGASVANLPVDDSWRIESLPPLPLED